MPPNPFGADGVFTKIGEHIPIVNNGIQELHRRAGKQEALERARERNPIGANGALTHVGEYVPGVNLAVQELHKRAGKTEALDRARERNPLGAHGFITQIGEQIPLVSDGIEVLHQYAEQHEARERAHGKSAARMMGKDGAITKIAELLPGSNILAAALHEKAGNHEEAERALDLLRNWRDLGSPDGALARLAEAVPGTSVVAFALHLQHGKYPQAVRSITSTSWVTVKIKSTIFCLKYSSVKELAVQNIEIISLELRPKGQSLMGGMLDMVLHFLEIDKSGDRRKQSRARWMGGRQGKSQSTSPANNANKRMAKFEAKVNDRLLEIVNWLIKRMPYYMELMLKNCSLSLEEIHQRKLWLRKVLVMRLPPATEKMIMAVQNAIPAAKASRGSLEQCHAPKCHMNEAETRIPEMAAAASCFGFAACLGLHAPTGLAACLAGTFAGVAMLGRSAKRRVIPWLNSQNDKSWKSYMAPKRPRSAPSSSSLAPVEANIESMGVIFDLPDKEVNLLSKPLVEYAMKQALCSGPSCLLRILAWPLRMWLASLFAEKTAHVLIHVEVSEQVVPGPPYDIWLPTLHAAMLLEVNLNQGSYLASARVAVQESMIQEVIEHLARQSQRWDLRELDPRLEGFREPLRPEFNLDVGWLPQETVRFVISDASLTLQLPH
mmetsp:Transcript_54200/g.117120  ORF Transcript_54200/g.117120 Transcript_54200/m.117120 type:complete len:665 (+) Transcript_54200:50-2044(+)